MKRVTAYESEDGLVYTSRAEAQSADARVALHRTLNVNGVCSGGEWDADMVAGFLVNFAAELAPLLATIAKVKP
jgi:hypothetical protein